MLPKLAEVFGVTTDELLGIEKQEVHPAEIVHTENDAEEPEGLHIENGTWELKWDGGRKSGVGVALWVLLVGGLLLASNLLNWNVRFWELLWPSGLLIFGLFGLYPKFSCFRLGCALFGGYFLTGLFFPVPIGKDVLLPVFLLLFGLSLLMDALRKPDKGSVHIKHNGKTLGGTANNYCQYNGETFSCATSFGENDFHIQLPRLSGGCADVSFGEMTVDLSGCEEIAEGCTVEANCSFGELKILVPRKYRAEAVSSTAFASLEVEGNPDPSPAAAFKLDCNASFGEIVVRYI